MQKLKYSVIENLIRVHVTDMELLFIFSVCQFQDTGGEVVGVYYRKIKKMMGCSIQTYYNVLRSLQEKGIIKVTKKTNLDCDIVILDNSFTDENFNCGYVSLRRIVFRTTLFRRLKVNAKLILIDLLSVLSGKGGRWVTDRNSLYRRYQELLGVSLRSVKQYVRAIRRSMEQIVRFSSCDGKFCIVLQEDAERNVKGESDDMKVNENAAECIFRRNGIREAGEEEVSQLAKLTRQYTRLAGEAGRNIFQVIADSVKNYLEWLNRCLLPKEKRNCTLHFPMLHKMIRRELGLETAG